MRSVRLDAAGIRAQEQGQATAAQARRQSRQERIRKWLVICAASVRALGAIIASARDNTARRGTTLELILTKVVMSDLAIAPMKQSQRRKNDRKPPKALGRDLRMPDNVRCIVARDPGESPGTCCLLTQAQPIVRTFQTYSYSVPPIYWIGNAPENLDHAPGAIAVTEGQWLKGDAKRRKAILTLSLRAGIWLGRVCERYGWQGFVLPVDVWKDRLFHGSQMDKFVHCNRIEKLLTPPELSALPIEGRHDALSAIGIAFAAYMIGNLTPYREV
jgi:hypothetical protein